MRSIAGRRGSTLPGWVDRSLDKMRLWCRLIGKRLCAVPPRWQKRRGGAAAAEEERNDAGERVRLDAPS